MRCLTTRCPHTFGHVMYASENLPQPGDEKCGVLRIVPFITTVTPIRLNAFVLMIASSSHSSCNGMACQSWVAYTAIPKWLPWLLLPSMRMKREVFHSIFCVIFGLMGHFGLQRISHPRIDVCFLSRISCWLLCVFQKGILSDPSAAVSKPVGSTGYQPLWNN